MVNMLKILIAVTVLLIIIDIAMLGKKLFRALIFKTAKPYSGESIWIERITMLITIGISLAYYIKNKPDADVFMWIGTSLFFLGGILQLIARRQLHEDKTFEDRLRTGFEAAQTGLYSKIRHPSKLALIIIILGFSMAMGSIWGLAFTIILFLPSMLFRISQEERTLMDEFGDRWIAYKEDTKRMIPGVL
ncbi:isoprenylcysteine carboxylmethyltransferase family protein [Candidatus Woesearchaeota archaeon]|nr:isoprenylcysteine carboxylmethyltransferase family protein [Candidatus Woesearchaeota archaeon]